VVGSSIVESQKRFGYLGICWLSHRYVYQCLFRTLLSRLMTFILVIAHVSSAIHLICSILQSSSASEKIPLESYVGLDFVVRLRMVGCQSLCKYKKLLILL
jgi:hypothetical protein